MGIYAQLAAAQSAMDNPAQDAVNPRFGSRYATLSAILDAVRPPLNANGLFINQTLEDGTLCTYVWNEAGESATLCRIPCGLPADPQKAGSTLTYARRYSLLTAFGLFGDPDDDGNEASDAAQEAFGAPSSGPFRVKCRSCGTEHPISDASRYADFLKSDLARCCPSPDWRCM